MHNTLTRDQGYLKIKKVFAAKTSGFNGTFTIHYNCGAWRPDGHPRRRCHKLGDRSVRHRHELCT